MFLIPILFYMLFLKAAQTLTIDSQLGTSIEDCFERTTLGQRLPPSAIYRIYRNLTAKECDKICKQDRQCQSYDYGVGAKGNATCELGSIAENDIKTSNALLKHLDYDVYIRRFNCEQSPPTPLFDDEPNISNRPVIRPSHFNDPPSKAPQRPLQDEEGPHIERPNLVVQKPVHDLQPYETNNWHTRPFINNVPYGRPIRNQYDSYYKPKPIGYNDDIRPAYERPSKPSHDQSHGDYNRYRPSYNEIDFERPDDYGSQKPEFDRPVGYGSHIPQDVPYKPRPIYNRPSIYRPSYSSFNGSHKPIKVDPNDVLYFQNHNSFGYNRPSKPESLRPDPIYSAVSEYEVNDFNRPNQIPYQKPNHHRPNDLESGGYQKPLDNFDYYVRPTKRPYVQQASKPDSNIHYGNEHRPDPIDSQKPSYDPPGYGSSGPLGPPAEKPYVQTRPQDQPFGSSQYLRPTIRPAYYDKPSSTLSNNHYNKYTPSNDYRPNYTPKPQRPTRPSYDYYHSSGYGSQSSLLNAGYGGQSSNVYGLNSGSAYGDQDLNHGIGESSNYGGQISQQSGYGNKESSNSHNSLYSGYGNQNSYGGGGSHSGSLNDQSSYGAQDIQTNQHQSSASSNYGSHSTQSGGYGNQHTQTGYGGQTNRPITQTSQSEGYGETNRPSHGISKPLKPKPVGLKPVYEYELDKPVDDRPGYGQEAGVEFVSSKPVAVGSVALTRPGYGSLQVTRPDFSACYRRVLAGRRALRSHVRRVLACERLEDCQRECAEESRFHCESFNYKLDPSFRGKGLCELMTKPIEYLDLQRDFVNDRNYDFYELDRNSLQPECHMNWHGPPLAHSGYLGSSTQDSKPSYDQNDIGYRRNHDHRRYYDRNSYRNYGEKNYRRRWGNQPFVPYQIGVGRSNDEDWGQYGGSYGQNFYDRNDHTNSLSYWGLDHTETPPQDGFYGVRPHGTNNDFNYYSLGNQRFNGNEWDSYSYGHGAARRWNHSAFYGASPGNVALTFGESSYYGPNHLHGDQHSHGGENFGSNTDYDCSSRRRAGMSLGSGAIRRSLLAHDVLDCESACFRETGFKCVSYSYRYSKSHGTENCFLSETPYRGLDLASDSGSDVYSMADRKQCGASGKPWIESECFLHIRSGKAVGSSAVRAALSVGGLGACEAECIRAGGFFCRGFSFRFDPPTIGEEIENCLLTSSPPSGLRDLRAAPGHELYARGNYGRGCEPDLTEDPNPAGTHCYLQYDNAARLLGAAARGRARVHDQAACSTACTDAPFTCLSFSFSTSSPLEEENCLLSEIRLFDLKLGVDYEHSVHDWLFAFDLFNKGCWRKIAPGYDHGDVDRTGVHTSELPRPLQPPPVPDPVPLPPSGPSLHPGYPSTYIEHPPHPHEGFPGHGRPGVPGHFVPPIGGSYHPGSELPPPTRPGGFRPSGYLPEVPGPPSGPSGTDFRPSYLPELPDFPTGPSGYPGVSVPHGHPGYIPIDGGNKEYDDFADQYPVSWRHYTVSGLPCRRGSVCAQNVIAGHWSCEPEGGEVGSWDYCCAPNHRCGYSEGFQKPWCYVGQSKDQWRPCSEKYYPYHQHKIPHPSQGHREDRPRPIRPDKLPPSRPHAPWAGHKRPEHTAVDYGLPGHGPVGYRPTASDSYLPYDDNRQHFSDFKPSPYLPEAERKYWDDLYRDGPQAYYDSQGNPLPGYVRVPTAERPHIKYHHNYGPHHSDDPRWEALGVDDEEFLGPPVPGGFGVPRYWPVAYLHKGPPPNTTYFNYQDGNHATASTEKYNYHEHAPMIPPNQSPLQDFDRKKTTEVPLLNNNSVDSQRNRKGDEKTRNLTSASEDEFISKDVNVSGINTVKNLADPIATKENVAKINSSETLKATVKNRSKDGIDDKLDDFSSASIEVLNLEDVKNQKGDKSSEIKTVEAEERQIEEIGRLLATRRGGKFIIEKRSRSDLETQNIKIARDTDEPDLDNFDFGSKFVPISSSNIERRGTVQKVPKDFVDAVKASASKSRQSDHSLEVSETSYARTTPNLNVNIKKAYVNGQVFYDATNNDQDKIMISDDRNERKPKFIKVTDLNGPENEPSTTAHPIGNTLVTKLQEFQVLETITPPQTFGQKTIKPKIMNPIRRGRRYYRRKYNPEEVRKRLLEREKSKEVQ